MSYSVLYYLQALLLNKVSLLPLSVAVYKKIKSNHF